MIMGKFMLKHHMFNLKNTLSKTAFFFIYIFGATTALADIETARQLYKNQQYEEAFKLYKIEAEKGNDDAQYWVGAMLAQGRGTHENHKESFEWLLKSANQGNPVAIQQVSISYLRGLGATQNQDLGQEWAIKGAATGVAEAQYYLGKVYLFENYGGKLNYIEGIKWVTKAADQGHAEALYYLGKFYSMGEFVQQDKEKAFSYLIKSADLGHKGAAYQVGSALIYADGAELDVKKGLSYLYKDAELGFPPAFALLAHLYGLEDYQLYDRHAAYFFLNLAYFSGSKDTEEGFKKLEGKLTKEERANAEYDIASIFHHGYSGFPQDHSRAADWYFRAATNGHLEAQIEMAKASILGRGVPKSKSSSTEWLKKAAEGGHARGQYLYADALLNGTGVEANIEDAETWFEKSVSQEYPKALFDYGKYLFDGEYWPQDQDRGFKMILKSNEYHYPKSFNFLAKAYFNGVSVEEDLEKAYDYFLKAAKRGDVDAQLALGKFHHQKDGKYPHDMELSFFWLGKAAEREHPHALTLLALEHSLGENLPRDMEKAFDYYYRAAMLDDIAAQEMLADFYANGFDGVEPNKFAALIWYNILSDHGGITSSGAVEQLEAELDPSQVELAREKAMEVRKQMLRTITNLRNDMVENQYHSKYHVSDDEIPNGKTREPLKIFD